MITRILLIINTFLALFLPAISNADRIWNKMRFDGIVGPGERYNISMGSGFFVNNNYIVTNRHVVERCRNIAIRGSVKPTRAKLILVDPKLDLAILHSPIPPKMVPYLRINYNQIRKDDIVFTAGFPLDNAKTGTMIVKSSKVLDSSTNPAHGFSTLKFEDVIDHGNSGGPILDKNSNIVGVVTAEVRYYRDGNMKDPTHSIGIAIGLDGLINFLKVNNIRFASNTSYDIFTNYNPGKIVKDYIVNIHCVQ